MSTMGWMPLLSRMACSSFVDIWGQDVSHDWYWWEKQWVYFLQMTLGDA
jgi:esterase/lipase superfamily enzyme